MNRFFYIPLPLIIATVLHWLAISFLMLPGMAYADADNLPAAAQRVLNRTNQLLEKNEVGKAIELLTDFHGKGADHYLVNFTMGNCYMMADRTREANAAYLKAVQQNSTYGPGWYNLAQSYMELDQYGQAAEAFVKAYACYDPKRPDILYYAASTYLAADRPEEALAVFNRLLSLHPADVKLEWLQAQVRILLANEMPEAALPVIERLANELQGDKQKEWQEFLLYHYLALNMDKKALAYARHLTKTDPLEPRWWKALAHIALNLDRYRPALVALTVYSHLSPLTLEEKKLMADLYLALDIPEQSVSILEDILADTTEAALIEKIVYGYTARHKPEIALQWIEKGIVMEPDNTKLIMLKGEIQFQMKAYADAEKTFKAVLDRDKEQGKAWLMLGYAAWYGEDLNTAIRAMKQAVKFPKQKKAAADALSGLLKIQKQKS